MSSTCLLFESATGDKMQREIRQDVSGEGALAGLSEMGGDLARFKTNSLCSITTVLSNGDRSGVQQLSYACADRGGGSSRRCCDQGPFDLKNLAISERNAQMRSNAVSAVLASFLAAAVAFAAHAQGSFPNRPITMVVPQPAGGTADLLCRLAADKAAATLGQQMVVENRPGGAGGRVGIDSVLRSAPDGYTVLCAPQLTFSVTHLLFKASFDTRALEPVSVLATYPLALVGRAGLPANNLAELIAYARANPAKVNYGHQGKGNTGHLLAEHLMLKGNFRMTEIPYRGSAPAINDLLAGTIDLVPDYLLANKQNIDAGKLKLLGFGSRERLKDYPNVATIAETLPGVYADTWMAVAAPPGTPKDIAKKVSDAIGQGFQTPDLRARILALEAEPLGSTPEQMREMIGLSTQLWAPVIEAAKITIE
jgi:tripartite-type tricarboxylate transporter receptor subunit TctC